MSCAFGPTVQTDPAFSLPEKHTFLKPVPMRFFVLGFVWTPETQTMTSSLGDVIVEFVFILFYVFYCIFFVAFNAAPR